VVTAVQAARIALQRDRAEEFIRYLASVTANAVPSPGQGRGATSREVLDTSAARVERDLSVQPDVRARVMFEMGNTYRDLAIYDRAQNLLEASVVLRRRLLPTGQRELAQTLDALGGVLFERGQLDSAARAYDEALALRRRLLGRRHGDVARTLVGLAAVRRAQGRLREAEAASREALEIDRARSDAYADVAQSLRGLGHVLLDQAHYPAAESLYNEALSLLRERPGDSTEVAGSMLDLAGALRGQGKTAAADSLLRHGLALYRRVAPATTVTIPLAPEGARVLPPATGAAPLRQFDSKIVFVTDRDGPDPIGHLGNSEIYVMNPDGSDQRRLTVHDGIDNQPAWSPDGKRIAFSRGLVTGVDVFVMNADGSEQKRVTHLTDTDLGGGLGPTWSPDGTRIAFQSYVQPDIYVINVDGTGLRNLTNHPARDLQPAWSPDGSRIAFLSNRDGRPEVYVMNADGTGPVRLTVNAQSSEGTPRWNPSPAWSPDGTKIAFASDRDGDVEIYVMNADGTGLVRLTFNPGEDGEPSWSPDGRRIAFHRRVLGHAQVFVMNADGSNVTRLTELSPVAFSGWPSWGLRPPPR
ncbi:MAG TPA: tetratricopeptide repeat protein, partial [Acidimicrobiia bacterium]|nr:tetratricopeptide repeat protein [Acidimicrobiia bacterium]